ncbi:MAG: iron-containing alcohol dehydrogenase [Verrucomicrobiales bacterium]
MPNATLSIESLCAGLDLPKWVANFDHAPGGKVIFGEGTLESIGREAREIGARKALLVSDPGIAKTGNVERARQAMEAEGIRVTIFDEVHENPTTRDVDRCAACGREAEVDLIVGLGGGSSMDTAKGCNFILTNGGRMQDYQGINRATKPMLPLIAVPTTSGTGSECQSFALIADAETHAKMACGDTKAAAAVVILDPELTMTMPGKVTAHTGIDAIAHAIETAVCNKRNDISGAYSRAAWRLLDAGFEAVLRNPDDLEARARMQLGAAFAGTAIENSMLGIAHSCANPLTARYGTVHGQAVGTMLPHVIAFNRGDPHTAAIYDELGDGAGLAQRVRDHLRRAGMAYSLRDLGIEDEELPRLAKEAAGQWTARFNPVPVSAESLEEVYRAAM